MNDEDIADPSRTAAAKLFWTVRADGQIVYQLEYLLNSPAVRIAAAGALGVNGTRRSLVFLHEAYDHETNMQVKGFLTEVIEHREKYRSKKKVK